MRPHETQIMLNLLEQVALELKLLVKEVKRFNDRAEFAQGADFKDFIDIVLGRGEEGSQ